MGQYCKWLLFNKTVVADLSYFRSNVKKKNIMSDVYVYYKNVIIINRVVQRFILNKWTSLAVFLEIFYVNKFHEKNILHDI